jgi:hypothetical protein
MRFLALLVALVIASVAPASFVTKTLSNEKPKFWKLSVDYVKFKGTGKLVRFANEQIRQKAKSILAEYLGFAKDRPMRNDGVRPFCTLEGGLLVGIDSPTLLSVHFSEDSYMGGNHPNVETEQMNFGILNGRPAKLRLRDLVVSPRALKKQIIAGLEADIKDRELGFSNFGRDLRSDELECFLITPHSLNFFYASPLGHAVGGLGADIPWSKVKGLKRSGPIARLLLTR